MVLESQLEYPVHQGVVNRVPPSVVTRAACEIRTSTNSGTRFSAQITIKMELIVQLM